MVTLQDIKAHLRMGHYDEQGAFISDGSEEDAYLESLAGAALAKIENDTDLSISAVTVTHYCNQFAIPINLPKYPVVDVTLIEYQDSSNVTQAVASWQEVNNPTSMDLYPYYDESWPQSNGQPNSVKITYQVGMAALPLPLKQAALLLLGHWYANRETVVIGTTTSSVPLAYDSLIQPYRRYAV